MANLPTTRAKRSLGQNFLIDQNFVRRIVAAVGPSAGDTIVEIGPGRGALTEVLLQSEAKIIAIELDRDLAPLLTKRFEGRSNFQLLSADALAIDFRELEQNSGAKLKIAANLPYNISTAMLQRLIYYRKSISEMVLMFQREVAERISATPGNSERGYLTVLVESFVSVAPLFDVPPTAFKPVPMVWSSVVRLRPKERSPLDGNEIKFDRLVSSLFRQKRKTIQNNLKSAAKELGIGDVAGLLESSKIDPSRRAETLTFDEWTQLFTELNA